MGEQYDLFQGRLDRDAGMAKVAGNNIPWQNVAMLALHRLPRGWCGRFEQTRASIVALAGWPTHPNAWCALTNHAVKVGLLRPLDVPPSASEMISNHARKAQEYERT